MTDYLVDARACSERRCRHGAECQLTNGVAECVCPRTCHDVDDVTDHHGDESLVCGSDGQTYGSACQLVLFACRLQKDISIAHYGPCRGITCLDLLAYLLWPPCPGIISAVADWMSPILPRHNSLRARPFAGCNIQLSGGLL